MTRSTFFLSPLHRPSHLLFYFFECLICHGDNSKRVSWAKLCYECARKSRKESERRTYKKQQLKKERKVGSTCLDCFQFVPIAIKKLRYYCEFCSFRRVKIRQMNRIGTGLLSQHRIPNFEREQLVVHNEICRIGLHYRNYSKSDDYETIISYENDLQDKVSLNDIKTTKKFLCR